MTVKHHGENAGRSHAKPRGILNSLKLMLDRNRLGELLVASGFITPQTLKQALRLQKETQHSLGRVLIDNAFINRRQLAVVLIKQKTLRAAAAFMLFAASFTHIKAEAGSVKDIPAQIAFNVAASGQYGSIGSYPDLFGSAEKRSGNLSPFTKWTGMFDRFEKHISERSGQKAVNSIQAKLNGLENLSLKSMAARVNELMNEKPYIEDKKNWGQSDYWATPVEFMQRGGDCEDYAIAKYTALRMLGVPEERMRIAIVQDTLKNIPHAILIVYTEQGPYALDNQIKTLVDADGMHRYRPIFSINQKAWWLHTAPEATVVASAE